MYPTLLASFVTLVAVATYLLYPTATTLYRAGNLFGNVTPVNTKTCRLVTAPRLEGCEDIAIHHDSGLAFMACSPISTRMQWLPPQNRFTYVPENDHFLVYNLKSDEVRPLTMGNFDGEFKALGLDVRTSDSDSRTVVIMAVNLASTGSAVEIFHYHLPQPVTNATASTQGSDPPPLPTKLIHVETVRHDLIRTPNDVVILSDRTFFVTNDHHYYGGLKAAFELLTARPWSSVVHRREDGSVQVAVNDIAAANGIVLNHDRSLAFVAATADAQLHVFQIDPVSGKFQRKESIGLLAYPDNLSRDPVSGDVYVTGVAKVAEYLKYCQAPDLKTTTLAGPRVFRLHNATEASGVLGVNYVVDEFLVEPGVLLPTGSVAAFDPITRKMLIGSLLSPGLLLCQF
ncbi:hypothetical protein IWQ60_008420 [Tieghemiomyces parasiticus]|uniref:Calcium-dependent phosphotriesterase n=1 Tax=Tieghemiomyces parasiticus TaxID=78921 RepID=A0A9W7ZS53_9FUNG|nr:hypothetical protein IWQ60_008420 [Tieghemiomyces parasiticus]